MFETLLYGAILLVIGVVVLFGSEAGITAAFLIVLLAIVGLFIAFPVVGLILFVILIFAILIKSTKAKVTPEIEAETQKSNNAAGCIISLLGILLMLPGGFAIFIALVLNDHVMLAAIAWIASILIGYNLMHYGSDD